MNVKSEKTHIKFALYFYSTLILTINEFSKL